MSEPLVPSAESRMTRRGLIRSAATASAVVAASGLLTEATGGVAGAAAPSRQEAQERADALTEPLMVRVADARTGALDIFHGQTHRTVHDRALAQALLDAAR